MNTVVGRALSTYARTEIETGVAAASPQRLIVMLYEGAIRSVLAAQAALARGDVAARGAAISKAISIIDEGLRPALDLEAGGEIAANLMALYEYLVHRLLYANLKADEPSLSEALRLLAELKGAWEALERQIHATQAADTPQGGQVPARAALSYGKA